MNRFLTASFLSFLALGGAAYSSDLSDEAIRLAQDLSSTVSANASRMNDNDLRNLNNQINALIQQVNNGGGGGGGGGGGSGDRLVCKTSGSTAAVFDVDTNAFIDQYYGQTLDVCNRIVNASRYGLTCASGSDGKTAVYDLGRKKFIGQYYSMAAADCIQDLQRSWNGLTCAADNSGTALAIYDVRNDRFVDSTYSKTLEQCLSSL